MALSSLTWGQQDVERLVNPRIKFVPSIRRRTYPALLRVTRRCIPEMGASA